MKRATQRDIAERAGVSQTAVSLVLSDRKQTALSPERRARVLAAALELGYFARRKRTGTIGFLVPWLGEDGSRDPFFSAYLAGIQAAITPRGCHVIPEVPDDVDSLPSSLKASKVDGYVVHARVSAQDRGLSDFVGMIAPIVPVVCVGGDSVSELCSTFVSDHGEAARQCVDALVDLGHRRLGFVSLGSFRRHAAVAQRLAGFKAAAAGRGVVVEDAWLHASTDAGASLDARAVAAVEHFLSLPRRPSAIACDSDSQMLPFMRAAAARGWDCPRQISLVSFDDLEAARYSTPSLSSVAWQTSELGRLAGEDLLARIEQPALPTKQVCCRGRLIVRDSLAAPEA